MALSPTSSERDARRLIENKVKDTWVAAGRDPAFIAWQNFKFQPPSRGLWVRVTILGAASIVSTIAGADGGTQIHRGVLILTFFGPKDRGLGELTRAADQFMFLERCNLGEVAFEGLVAGPSDSTVGDEAWASMDMSFGYYFYRQNVGCGT